MSNVDVYAAICRFPDNDKEVCLRVSAMTGYIMLVYINMYANTLLDRMLVVHKANLQLVPSEGFNSIQDKKKGLDGFVRS